jgi:hypothetical protein
MLPYRKHRTDRLNVNRYDRGSKNPVDIWTVDKGTIRAEIRARNALRQSALLPLLDEQKELEHVCSLIRDRRWSGFKGSPQARAIA